MTNEVYRHYTDNIHLLSVQQLLVMLEQASGIKVATQAVAPLIRPYGNSAAPRALVPDKLWGYSALESSGSIYCVWLKIKSPKHEFTIDTYSRLYTSEDTPLSTLKQTLLTLTLLVVRPNLCTIKDPGKWSWVAPF